ncbi:jerky protein homolog-like [Argiope bruennichi]|uniref:jerky protein homolog-like n=1 Tax=Argiope bruennichi TaxID=94029 RepID=UPI002495076F|nr:jerky protein homolog-like [Argiope bruennichi]
MSGKRKKVVLTIAQKLELISKVANGATRQQMELDYGIAETTLRDILKQKDKLVNFASMSDSASAMKTRKIMKGPTFDELHTALTEWLTQVRKEGTPVNGPIIAAKAKTFFELLDLKGNFDASSGWLTRFKQRHGMREIGLHGEKLSGDQQAVDDFQHEFEEFVLKELSFEQIYNADESGLLWTCLPTHILAFESESKSAGHKSSKERITIMSCSNATGGHKLRFVVIGKSKKPISFKGTKFWKHYTILDSIYDIASAWDSVKPSTLTKSWRKLMPNVEANNNLTPLSCEDVDTPTATLADMVKTVPGGENVDVENINEWLECDVNEPGFERLAYDEIVKKTRGETENDGERSECEEEPTVQMRKTREAALQQVDGLLSYLEEQDDAELAEKLMLRKMLSRIKSTTFAHKKSASRSHYSMKLFWIMVFCIAVVTLVSSKPSSLRDLTKEAPRVHKDGLIGSMKMVKRIKRSPRNNDGMDATTQPAMTATESSDPGLLGGLNALLDGIVKLLGDLLGTVL